VNPINLEDMKLSDVNEFINIWPKSMGILKSRIIHFIEREGLPVDNLWFPDIDIVFPHELSDKKEITVIFLGGFLERIFETGNWPDKKYTFFCLSSRVKRVLTKMFNFPDESIRVIPRREIFSESKKLIPLNLKDDLHLFYSGRFSSQKNIEMILAFYKALEEATTTKVTLTFFGEWDNNIPKNRGRYIIESYEKEIDEFIGKLPFKNPPQFITNLNSDEWIKKANAQSLLVNFSTFVCEDYGVSIAQAQEIGIPMLLSNWGGHGDVVGENIQLVPVSDIAESFAPFDVVMLKAQAVTKKFLSGSFPKAPAFKTDDEKGTLTYLGLRELECIRHFSFHKHGQEICLLGQDRQSLFASSGPGKIFFKEYTQIFSGAIE
jgi:glycosyltransferase involved in cell wall biosynthesis